MVAKNPCGYRSASRLALWASVLFVVYAATATVAALLNVYQIALLDISRSGRTIPIVLAEAQDARQYVITALEFGMELMAIFLLLVWLYRVSRNTWSFGIEGLQYTPGWSVGWFFVPIAGLVMPYNVFHELWRANKASDPERWRQAPASPLLGFWWATCVAGAIIHYEPLKVMLGQGNMVKWLSNFQEDSIWLDSLSEFYWGRLIYDIVAVAMSLLTVLVINRLTTLQKRRYSAVDESAGSDGS
jgi:hypothetical protein